MPQWTSRIRQLGEGEKGLVAGAGAEAVGVTGTVDPGVRERAWAEAVTAGAGAGAGVGLDEATEDGTGVEAERDLEPVRPLPSVCSDGPLKNGRNDGFHCLHKKKPTTGFIFLRYSIFLSQGHKPYFKVNPTARL